MLLFIHDPIKSLQHPASAVVENVPSFHFMPLASLLFIFLYFIVLSHPLCQTVFFCIFLNSLSFKEIIFMSHKCYMV